MQIDFFPDQYKTKFMTRCCDKTIMPSITEILNKPETKNHKCKTSLVPHCW